MSQKLDSHLRQVRRQQSLSMLEQHRQHFALLRPMAKNN
jgi:hypothetical protein